MAGGGGALASVLFFALISIIQLVIWVYLGSTDRAKRKKIATIEITSLVIIFLSLTGPSLIMLVGMMLISPILFLMLLTPLTYKLVQCIKTHNKPIKQD